MAGALSLTSSFGQLIADLVGDVALSMGNERLIGYLMPHVVTEEIHEDRLAITTHPVETGTPVSDHAYPMPYTVEIRCGWSNSTAGSEGFVQAIYQKLLALQGARQPFTIRTGKRKYGPEMLIASLAVKTDDESEFALMVVVFAQQIKITSVQTTGTATQNTDGSSWVGQTSPGQNLTGPQTTSVDPPETVWPNDPTATLTLSMPGAAGAGAVDWAGVATRIGLGT